MPGGDGTGPVGMGPMTGRAAGFCAGYGMPGYLNGIPGRGFWGRGRGGGWGRGGGGGGWGRRNWFYTTGLTGWQRAAYGYPAFGGLPAAGVPFATPSAAPYAPTIPREQEIEMLKGQAEYFEDALDGIKKRIEELENRSKET